MIDRLESFPGRRVRRLEICTVEDLARTSLPELYNSPQRTGDFPSEIRRTAPMSWRRIVFIENVHRDDIHDALGS